MGIGKPTYCTCLTKLVNLHAPNFWGLENLGGIFLDFCLKFTCPEFLGIQKLKVTHDESLPLILMPRFLEGGKTNRHDLSSCCRNIYLFVFITHTQRFYGETIMKFLFVFLFAVLFFPDQAMAQQYLGKLSNNPYNADSVSNPYGQYGNKYSPNSINNTYGQYGNVYSDKSVNNPYADNAPKLYDSRGNYRGKLSNNKYDPESISNPYGKYGSKYSPDSINNPYGAGNPYSVDSPNNPYGNGWTIIGDD